MNISDWFCPLIKNECNPRCVCYRPEHNKTIKSPNHGEVQTKIKSIPACCTHFQGPIKK